VPVITHFLARRLLCALAILTALILAPSTRGQQPAAKPSIKTAEEVSPLNKREKKAQKRERQREQMLKRIAQRVPGQASAKPVLPPAPPNPPRPYMFAEDFDRAVQWDHQELRKPASPGVSFGYAGTHHLAAAGCAPGEIGGSVSDIGSSWFAEDIALGAALLDVDGPLSASGWCLFTATQGQANVGWFNSQSYAAPAMAPDAFIGWRQEGGTLRVALGHTGSSFVTGPALAMTEGKPFHWTLRYSPTGGAHARGQITLTIGDASSTLSLTGEQRSALAARKFNRLGMVTARTGAGSGTSTFWLDNLVYTKVSGFPAPHAAATAQTRTAFFDTDPTGSTFFAVNNLSKHDPVTVIQDYGYQPKGGRSGGCVGGRLSPAIGLSYYGYDYGEQRLHFSDKLRSEGWIQVPGYEGRCFHLGWTSKHGMSWHEPSTLAIRISSISIKGQGRCINVAAEGTLKNYEGHGGAGWGAITTFPAGPEWHHYVMEFDPAGGHGLGTFTVQFDGISKVFYFGEDKIQKGGDIEIFGMWNAKLPAEEKVITAYLDDVTNTTNGQRDPASHDFNAPPAGWVGRNNVLTAKDYIIRPYHEFGWARSLPHLDGLNGFSPMYTISDRYCMGGIIYLASFENLNVPRASYGAGLNGTLNTKEHHLYATGRFKLDWANVDAGELFGWYNSATACDDKTGGKGHGLPNSFLGVAIAAGSNGYGMIPSYRSPLDPVEETLKAWNPATRVYEDGEWREFYLEYDPDGAGGKGQLKLQLGKDGVPVTFDLKEKVKGAEFAFDRFGLLTHRKGGGKPHAIYFDKLTYTVSD
jgi:hypothetical protein